MSHGQPVPLPAPFPFRPEVVFTDVDDTLTWQGQVPLETQTALYRLVAENIQVVPVTGASAGWCDCLMKIWPIHSIIGENGAFYMHRTANGTVCKKFLKPEAHIARDVQRLRNLGDELNRRFPDIGYTQDQPFRITEVAFDIGQVARVPDDRAMAATEWLQQHGVSAKRSSIHINAWLGDHSKSSGALAWLADHGIATDRCVFIGDSPNDESMFEQFQHTIGVANIRPFLPLMRFTPTFITQQKGGFGFSEFVDRLFSKPTPIHPRN